MKRIILAFAVAFPLAASAAVGADIEFVRGLSQSAFRSFAREAGVTVAFKNTAPAAPLGITGFDVGVEVTAIDIGESAEYWKAATGDDAPSYFLVPKLRARKGLPFGIDVGAMYSAVPSSNIQLVGAELSKALLDGGLALPAIGLRATYTRLMGVEHLDLQTAGLDASISKGFLFITPYAGAGVLWIDANAKGPILTDPLFIAANGGKAIEREKLWQSRFFGGVKLSPLPLLGITGEVEYADVLAYSVKLALSF